MPNEDKNYLSLIVKISLFFLLPLFASFIFIKFYFTHSLFIESVSELNYTMDNMGEIMLISIEESNIANKMIGFPSELIKYDVSIINKLEAQIAILDEKTKNDKVPRANLINDDYHRSILACNSDVSTYNFEIDYNMRAVFANTTYETFINELRKIKCRAKWNIEVSDNVVLVYRDGFKINFQPTGATKVFTFLFLLLFQIAIIKIIRESIQIITKGRKYFL